MAHKFGTFPFYIMLMSILWVAVPHFEQAAPTLTVSPDNSRPEEIAFTADNNGTQELSLVNADGSNVRNLTDVDSSAPTFSPDGRQIAFQSTRNGKWEIFLMNADGSDQHSLGNGARPIWSPDGDHIAFITPANGDRGIGIGVGIGIMNADGSNRKAVVPSPNSPEETAFAWSPDGKYLCFTAPADNGTQIFTVNSDGSSLHQLTAFSDNFWPQWSPDGKQIAFSFYGYGGSWYIYTMNADGSNNHQVSSAIGGDAWLPFWSPDGKSIAFISNILFVQSYIYQVDANGANQHILVSMDSPINGNTVWSPNGEQIAFVSNPDPRSESLYVVDVDGNHQPHEIVSNVLGAQIEWLP